MTTDYSPGALSKVSINGTAMSVLSSTMGKKEVLLQRNGIRGTRSHFDTDVRKGPQAIGGTINLEPSYAELVALMALAIGAGGVAANSLTAFNTVVDRVVRPDTYTGCKIGRATIAGTQGGIISCSLDIVGETEVVNTGTVSTPASTIPFIMADALLTLCTAQSVHSFTLIIDNHLDAERFLNSVTLSEVIEHDRTVSLAATIPYRDSTLALYDQAVTGVTGATLALNNGTSTGTFSFGKLQTPAETPDIPGKTEIMLMLNMIATKINASNAGVTDDIGFV